MSFYDENNIFARILRGEVPCQKFYEDDDTLAFHDISPKAPVHLLVIPKGSYRSSFDFYGQAPDRLITAFHRFLGLVIEKTGLKDTGYRLISNHGIDGNQEVPHFHVHVLGGRPLGGILAPR